MSTILEGPLPGEAVDRHLKLHGHLPALGCCEFDQPVNLDYTTENKDIKIESEDVPVEVKEPEKTVVDRIVPPHSKKSREVTDADVDRVTEEAKILHEICFFNNGVYHGAYAMHHAQIDDQDPLNFFVTVDRQIVINPVIKNHVNYTVDSKEGCVSYAGDPQATVQRWHKLLVNYVTIMVDPENKDKFKLSNVIEEDWSGFDAKVFQHEFDHGQAKYIYSQDKI